MCPFVRPSVCPSVRHTFLTFLSSYHPEIFRSFYHWQTWCPYEMSNSEVNGRGQDPTQRFPHCNSSLNSRLVMKWYTKLDVTQKRCPIVFQCHPWNFKATRLKKSLILTQIGRFWTITPVWIQWWLWNDAQSLKQHRKVALLFFKFIRQISRSHGTKMDNFEPNWAFPDCNYSLNSPTALKWCTKLNVV